MGNWIRCLSTLELGRFSSKRNCEATVTSDESSWLANGLPSADLHQSARYSVP